MSEVAVASSGTVTELKVTASVMHLDPGVYCVFYSHPLGVESDEAGLPGIRISVPPSVIDGSVSVATFRDDGWVGAGDSAALVRVTKPAAPVLVTVYHSPRGGSPPRLKVTKVGVTAVPAAGSAAIAKPITAHVQTRGDIGADFGEWIGMRGSKAWIEGFAVEPPIDIPPGDLEYQAVLGRDWLSPWSEGGQFLGSRGMALPVLGFKVRLRGDSAELYDCIYEASFVDGSGSGPVENGAVCVSDSLAPLEAFLLTLRPRGGDLD